MGVFVDRLSFLAYSIAIYGFVELVSGYIDIQGEPRYTRCQTAFWCPRLCVFDVTWRRWV